MRFPRGLGRGRGRRTRTLAAAGVVTLVAASALFAAGVNPAVPQAAGVTSFQTEKAPALDPTDGVWSSVPGVEIPLSAQKTTYPFGGGQIPAATVRSVHTDDKLYVHLTYRDPTLNDESDGFTRFADAAAVQFPATAGSTVPFFCMGQVDIGVNIWQWRADTQRGIPENVEEISERGYVDMYPSTDPLWYPARDVGNVMATKTKTPVQNLVALGFGTLTQADTQVVAGKAAHTGDEWQVVFRRDFASPGVGQPTFTAGTETDVAVAVWNGAERERNGLKSVSQFTTLTIGAEPVPPNRTSLMFLLLAAPFVVMGGVALVFWRLP